MGFKDIMAGRGGRSVFLDFINELATAFSMFIIDVFRVLRSAAFHAPPQ
jgi:hypothetical protein